MGQHPARQHTPESHAKCSGYTEDNHEDGLDAALQKESTDGDCELSRKEPGHCRTPERGPRVDTFIVKQARDGGEKKPSRNQRNEHRGCPGEKGCVRFTVGNKSDHRHQQEGEHVAEDKYSFVQITPRSR